LGKGFSRRVLSVPSNPTTHKNPKNPNVLTQLRSDYLACFDGFMKAIGYVRVSTDKQADFGVSLEAQQEKVRARRSFTAPN
jgi:hypothetical protein